jgi:hypothetical protein
MIKAIATKSERVGQKANVTVQADNLEEAQSKASREAAIEHGTMKLGMNRPGISGTPWMEWVDQGGNSLSNQQAFEAVEAKDRAVHISWPLQEGL